MKKKNFLEVLISTSPQEINKIIEEKGKKPKFINPIVILDKSKGYLDINQK